MLKGNSYFRKKIVQVCLTCTLSASVLLAGNSKLYYGSDGVREKAPVFVLKNQEARQYNEATKENYGILLHSRADSFNYMLQTKKSFIFAIAHNFSSTDFKTVASDAYQNKYIYLANEFLHNLADYSYTTEKEIFLFDFNSLNGQTSNDIDYTLNPNLVRLDYFNNPSNFYGEVYTEGTSYVYADSSPQAEFRKPRFIIGVVKEGKIYDYKSYSQNPYFFTKGGLYGYLNSLTYATNVYDAVFQTDDIFLYPSTNMFCSDNLTPEQEKNYIGCRLGNNSNTFVRGYTLYGAQNIANYMKDNDILVYNYDSFNDENRYFFHNYLPTYNSNDVKIYVTDIDYYAYNREDFFTYNPQLSKVKKLDSYSSAMPSNYVPLYGIDKKIGLLTDYASIPYFALSKDGQYVDFAGLFDYYNFDRDIQNTKTAKNYSLIGETNKEYKYTVSFDGTNLSATKPNAKELGSFSGEVTIKNNHVTNVVVHTQSDRITEKDWFNKNTITINNQNQENDPQVIDISSFTQTYGTFDKVISGVKGNDFKVYDNFDDSDYQLTEDIEFVKLGFIGLINEALKEYRLEIQPLINIAKSNDQENLDQFIDYAFNLLGGK